MNTAIADAVPPPEADTPEVNLYGRNLALLYEHAFNGWIAAFAPRLREHLARRVSKDASLLDLCCGTGETARVLLEGGWRIVGIDRSPHMLEIAQAKHAAAIAEGRIVFARACAETFESPERFDVCVCVDGALNHMTDTATLEACFRRVARALRPGGLFVFDLLEASHFARWREIHVSEDADHLLVRRGAWDPGRNLARLTISGGVGGAALWRVRETLSSRTFDPGEVEALLLRAGLEPMACELEDPRPTGRSFYQAVKPPGDRPHEA